MTRSAAPRPSAQQVFDELARSASTSTTWWTCSRTRGRQKFDASWAELVETVQTALDEAKQGQPMQPRVTGRPDATIGDVDVIV